MFNNGLLAMRCGCLTAADDGFHVRCPGTGVPQDEAGRPALSPGDGADVQLEQLRPDVGGPLHDDAAAAAIAGHTNLRWTF